MSSQCIIKWQNLSVEEFLSRVRIGKPRANPSGFGKSLNISYINDNGESVRPVIQTPKMHAPFGVSKYVNEKDKTESFSLVLSFKGVDTDPRMAKFRQILEGVDALVRKTAFENQNEWLGFSTDKDMAIIEDRHTATVQKDDAGKWPDKIRAKVDVVNDEFKGIIINASGTKIKYSEVEKNGYAIALLEMSSAWIGPKQFGMSLRMVQLKSFPIARLDYVAIEDDSEDHNGVEVAHADPDGPALIEDDDPAGAPYRDYYDVSGLGEMNKRAREEAMEDDGEAGAAKKQQKDE